MKFKVTTIVENTVPVSMGLLGEHGLSFLIESEGRKILFDTGQGMALINNLDKTGHPAAGISMVVLSHGHYDHAGGLRSLMAAGAEFELFAHPDAFTDKCAMYPGRGVIPIGAQGMKDEIAAKGLKMSLDTGPAEIAPGVMSTGEIPQVNDFEKIEPMLLVREGGKEIQDPLADDQALILDSEKGIVVILGCAHRGVVNTLNRVSEITGGKPVHAVLGGLHLERAPDAQIAKTIETLRGFDLKMLGVTHCTGLRAMVPLINEFGGRVFQASVGLSVNF